MEQKQSAVELTQQMVRIDSTNPGAGENGMEQFLLSFGEKLKQFNDRVMIRTEEVLPGRNNVMLPFRGRSVFRSWYLSAIWTRFRPAMDGKKTRFPGRSGKESCTDGAPAT